MTEQLPRDRLRVNFSTTTKATQPEVTYEHFEGNPFMEPEEIARVLEIASATYEVAFNKATEGYMRQWEESAQEVR